MQIKGQILKKEQTQANLAKLLYLESDHIKTLSESIKNLKEKYDLTTSEVLDLITFKQNFTLVPISIFSNCCSPLESLVKFLKEEQKLKFSQIATILKRDETTIWTTYNNAFAKRKTRVILKKTEIAIPLFMLSNRKLSILEIVCCFLRKKHNLSFHQIGVFLNKNDRTIWTVCNRARKKNEQ